MLKKRLRALKSINMGMENELSFLQGEVSFLQGELQEAQWRLRDASRMLQYLRGDADRRRQAATARQRRWRQNRR